MLGRDLEGIFPFNWAVKIDEYFPTGKGGEGAKPSHSNAQKLQDTVSQAGRLG